jgi:undecaprenyl-diphosphatase
VAVNINIQLLFTINALARSTPWLQPWMTLYATVGGLVLFVELMFIGWWIARRRTNLATVAAALWTPLGMLLAVGINQPISAAFAERRPYLMYTHLLTLTEHSWAPGFPSDHAVLAGAVTATLFLVSRPLGWCTALAAAIMAFARVYVAEAYPFDVLAGLGLGAAVSLIGYLLVRRVLVRLLGMADPTIFRGLITATPRQAPWEAVSRADYAGR